MTVRPSVSRVLLVIRSPAISPVAKIKLATVEDPCNKETVSPLIAGETVNDHFEPLASAKFPDEVMIIPAPDKSTVLLLDTSKQFALPAQTPVVEKLTPKI